MRKSEEAIFSLHRYFISANRMRTHFDELLQSGSYSTPEGEIESRLYLSYWYAGLYVVVEGWKELALSDAEIDSLLKSPNLDLHKRYRNGIFHFQRRYNDHRFTEFIENGINIVTWVRDLNTQFGRYFLDVLTSEQNKK
jgi:hypothetical protein